VQGAVTPNVIVDPAGIPVSQPEPIQVQPSDGPINASAGAAVFIGTPSIVQVAMGEGAPIGPAVQRSPQDVVEESKTKLEFLEERLRAIEGGGSFGFGDIAGLCLVFDLVIPPKFKVPEFEKYKGTSCPRNHLIMYCRKMATHAGDEKLLMHFFQDSLVNTALSWYMRLEPTRIRSWNDLVDAFFKQYRYNVDMAPDRLQLQNMSKKNSETFKEYAQRWRELAAQVEPIA